jgi:VIT1/CCC1 family predicted Fe2+/Mn2+ transporter
VCLRSEFKTKSLNLLIHRRTPRAAVMGALLVDEASWKGGAPVADDPAPADVRRWRQHLANERAEAVVYRNLARHRTGEERDILLALAEAEARHEAHWLELLGGRVGKPRRADLRTRVLGLLARWFGSVFVLALAQRAEARSPYQRDVDATSTMAADERMHEEVVRALAVRGRSRLSGTLRAAVFGANDGLVSNLSLIVGVTAAGVPTSVVLLTGVAGLLAGALSMGAGEYVSVRSQRELLQASSPNPDTRDIVQELDIDANELALLFRVRGLEPQAAQTRAADVLRDHSRLDLGRGSKANQEADEHEAIGTGLGAAASSFCFFGSGALIPILPYLFGLQGMTAILVAAILVGLALVATGAVVGMLSGASPIRRGLRQLLIGYGAATATYLLGLALGARVS